ncbi:7-carboxy-7-deazaguanine synthase [Polynucleobacter acidiphobus]|uniref:7-carboxy-7-deazaguanine synthase n=1 Tax=Polynucleobacter acidiphobus TaxID=556053 RepID=UPI000D3C4110|nr:7-carboxy-7-deazaguanine synthase [Polynucleobacter acidiphobus]
MYSVKEIFATLQGEGAQAGRAAVFCRFAGCNLWSGREEDRSSAICQFCDTDFVGTDGIGGGKFASPEELAQAIENAWIDTMRTRRYRYVVMTGGEPLLQLDEPLIKALHAKQFEIAIESNGTIAVPKGIDWVCLSPKAGAELVVKQAHEIKLVVPQAGHQPIESVLQRFEAMDFRHRYIQAMDGPNLSDNMAFAVQLCQKHPLWRLSVQTHKMIGIR